jgi:diguanylate cyclase (GGDEF)-like protein/PAS domain S-box-containing protein
VIILQVSNKKFIILFITGGLIVSILLMFQEFLLGHTFKYLSLFLPILFGGISFSTIYYFYEKKTNHEKVIKENRYKKLFDNTNNAVAIYRPIENGNNFEVVDINQKAIEIDNHNKDEVIGMKFTELSKGKYFSVLFEILKEVNKTGVAQERLIKVTENNKIITFQRNYIYKLDNGEVINIYEDITEKKRQEKVLKEKNELLQGLMDNMLVGILVGNRNGDIIHLNKGFEKITGYNKNDINSLKDWLYKAYPDKNYRKKVIDNWEEDSKKGSAVKDFEVTCKEGTKKLIHFRVNFIGNRYVASMIDISEKNLLINEIQEKTNYLNKVVSNIPGILLILDEDGKYIDIWSSQHKDLVGPSSTLKGKNINDILPQEVAKKYFTNIKNVIKSNEIIKFDYSLSIDTEIRYFEAKLILMDETNTNEKNKFLVLINNITNRVEKEQTLKTTKERLELIIDTTELGIFDVDLKNDNVVVNDNIYGLTGYKEDDIDNYIGFWLNKIHKDDKRKTVSELNNHFDGKNSYVRLEHRLKTKNNGYKWFRLNGNLIESDSNSDPIRFVGILQDIDQKKKINIKLKEQKAHFKQLFENSIEAIALLDYQYKVIKINSKFEEVFGYKQEEIKDKKIDEIITPDEYNKGAKKLNEMIIAGKDIKTESIRRKKDGSKINVSVHGFSVNISDKRKGIYAIYNDITERKKIEKRFKYLSYNDELTDLYNRRYFNNKLNELNSSNKVPISIIIGDLDGLKLVNDNFGHSEGDKYIKRMADILKSVVRDEDVVSRLGGDEFAVLLPKTSKKCVNKICDRIERECKKANDKNDYKVPLKISLGYYTITSKEEDLYNCFNKADKEMYSKKGKTIRISDFQ